MNTTDLETRLAKLSPLQYAVTQRGRTQVSCGQPVGFGAERGSEPPVAVAADEAETDRESQAYGQSDDSDGGHHEE